MHKSITWDRPQTVRDLELAAHLLPPKWQTANKPPWHCLHTCSLTIQSLAEALFSRRDLLPEDTPPSSSLKPLLFRATKFLVFFASGGHANFLQSKIHFHESRVKRVWGDYHYAPSFGRTVIGSHIQSPAVKLLPKFPLFLSFSLYGLIHRLAIRSSLGKVRHECVFFFSPFSPNFIRPQVGFKMIVWPAFLPTFHFPARWNTKSGLVETFLRSASLRFVSFQESYNL